MNIPLLIRDLVLLLFVALLVIAIARKLAIPYTLGLVIAGLGLGLLRWLPEVQLTPDFILFVLLPALLFEGAWHSNLQQLRNNWRVIFFLAGPGLLFSVAIIALLLHLLEPLDWPTAFLLAAILSPTDPVAVLGLFHQLHVNERLSSIIEGESLFNDGVAGSLYQTFLLFLVLSNHAHPVSDWHAIGIGMWHFIIDAGGGAAIGAVIAFLISLSLRRVNDSLIEVTATLVTAYGTFWIAQTCQTSGITAVIVAGLLMGNYGRNTSMSQKTSEDVDTFWNVAAFIANAIIFLLIGVEFQPLSHLFTGNERVQTWIVSLFAIAVILIARLFLVSMLTVHKWLRRPGWMQKRNISLLGSQALPYSWQVVVFWSGLRGALSLALVLAIPTVIPMRSTLLVSTYAVVLFTLLVQGFSLRWMLRRVLSPTSKEHLRDLQCVPEQRIIKTLEGVDS